MTRRLGGGIEEDAWRHAESASGVPGGQRPPTSAAIGGPCARDILRLQRVLNRRAGGQKLWQRRQRKTKGRFRHGNLSAPAKLALWAH